jgi:hypothetical protein
VGKDNPINIKPGLGTEASQRIHALAFPDACWHDVKSKAVKGSTVFFCSKCPKESGLYRVFEPPDYFSDHLPDNLRVAMVTAAKAKFGEAVVDDALTNKWLDDNYSSVWALPAPAIAEAIDRLLVDAKEVG